MHAYVKQLLKNPVFHEEIKRYFRKPIRRAVASWVFPELQFVPERAGYKREHPKLTYNKTSRFPLPLEQKNSCCCLCFAIVIHVCIMLLL
jgi:hypothetical protein